MKLVHTNVKALKLGHALTEVIKESEAISGVQLPYVAKKLMVASFISGAQWGAGHPTPQDVLKECEKGQELFNKITT